jgi:NADPH2:quinone reductase
MKAWRVHERGSYAEVLRFEECEPPSCPDAGALVRMEAAALNFPDLLVMQGQYQVRPELPFTPGMEGVGRIVEVGPRSARKVGERVIVNGLWGCVAELAAAEDRYLFPIPEDMDAAAAAAMHVIYQTSYFALAIRTRVEAGETLLVHGGSGGVGTSAIQLGKAFGARVIATGSSQAKLEVCRRAGADELIDYQERDFVEAVMQLTDGAGADVIYDPVGGEVFDKSSKCIAFGGRLLVIGFASGRIPSIAANRILLKNISVIGLHWGNYYLHRPELVHEVHATLLELYRAGKIAPMVSQRFAAHELIEAYAEIAERRSWGKVVVDLT